MDNSKINIINIKVVSVLFCIGLFLLGGTHELALSQKATIPSREPIIQLCKRFPSDKCQNHHNYVEMYETLFAQHREKRLRFLEIGVLNGHSMKLWEAYFPSAQIFGVDIKKKTQYDTQRIKTFVADQGKRPDLQKLITATGGNFDIILDDGGHKMDQQQISFGMLFPTLKSGGFYIIEDIHTSFPNLYPGYGVEAGGDKSTYAMIDRFVKTGKISSKYLTREENEYLSKNVSRCLYFLRANRFHSDFFACWKI